MMMQARPLKGCLAVAMYAMIVLESMSLAICIYYGINTAMTAARLPSLYDSFEGPTGNLAIIHLSLLIYVWLGVAGNLVGIPCICAALHKLKHGPLIPYLIWRLFFTLATIALGVVIGIYSESKEASLFSLLLSGVFDSFYPMFVPPIAVQGLLGMTFIVVTLVAIAKLKRFNKAYRAQNGSPMMGKEQEMAISQVHSNPYGTLQQQQSYGYGNWNPYYWYQYGR